MFAIFKHNSSQAMAYFRSHVNAHVIAPHLESLQMNGLYLEPEEVRGNI
jgi:hypothetical protein